MPVGTLGYEWGGDVDNGFRPAGPRRPLVDDDRGDALRRARWRWRAVPGGGVFIEYGHTVAVPGRPPTTSRSTAPRAARSCSAPRASSGRGASTTCTTRRARRPIPNMQQATVNLFADMGIQPGSLMAGLDARDAHRATPADRRPPFTDPAPRRVVDTGQPVSVTGTAADVGGVVGGVEVSVDGSTWHPATPDRRRRLLVDLVVRLDALDPRRRDPPGPGASTTAPTSARGHVGPVTVAYSCPCSIFGTAAAPTTSDCGRRHPGRARREVPLRHRRLRQRRPLLQGGREHRHPRRHALEPHRRRRSRPRRSPVSPTPAGRRSLFSSPVAVQADTTYVASYSAPAGHYSGDNYAFTASGIDTAPLHAPAGRGRRRQRRLRLRHRDRSPRPRSATRTTGSTRCSSTASAPTRPPDGARPPRRPTATSMSRRRRTPTVDLRRRRAGEARSRFTLHDAADQPVAGSVDLRHGVPHRDVHADRAARDLGGRTPRPLSAVEDAAGNAIAAPVSWSFTTTATPPDTTPPTVTTTTPAAGCDRGRRGRSGACDLLGGRAGAARSRSRVRDASKHSVSGATSYDAADAHRDLRPVDGSSRPARSTPRRSSRRAQDAAGNTMTAPD